MRKIEFFPGEYYHIFNHGVDERRIFLDENDFLRFLAGMAIFNDEKVSPYALNQLIRNPENLIELESFNNRERLVEIISFTLLPTHYHLFVREKAERGISRFMHRLDKSYARYFNLKNGRKGTLWQGKFGAKHINEESYFIHIISYIHLNILDLYFPVWREGQLKEDEWSQAASKLADYPWSSYGFYRNGIGKIPFVNSILTKPEWLDEYYPNLESFELNLHNWSSRFMDIVE